MDREEAIKEAEKRLSSVSFQLESGGNLNAGFRKIKEREYKFLRGVVFALRAQQTATKLDRSRWEGFDYCAHQKDNVELCPMLSHDESDCDRGMYIHDGCLISNSGEFQYAEIKFCPMCGRPLTEEAWAELERRINGE